MVKHTLCGTFSGLSKIYRACGYRVGWVSFNGEKAHARGYLDGIELMSSLRLCSNVSGQWAVQTALGGHQSVHKLVSPLVAGSMRPAGHCRRSQSRVRIWSVCLKGALYAFVKVNTSKLPDFDDERFAMNCSSANTF